MLSQSPGIYILLGAILGSIISGSLLIINTSVNNKFQLEREKQERIWQEKSDQQKWYREKLYNCYRTSFQILLKIYQEECERIFNEKIKNVFDLDKNINNINQLILEFNFEFSIIIVDHPDKNSKEFKEKIDTIDKFLTHKSDIIRSILIEIMNHDPRIKDVSK